MEVIALTVGVAAARWGQDHSRGDSDGSAGSSHSSHALRASQVMYLLLVNPHYNPTRGRIIILILQML